MIGKTANAIRTRFQNEEWASSATATGDAGMVSRNRTERYTIIEFSMFEGRTMDAKKQLIRLLFGRVHRECGISPQDLEMTIFETPKHDWGFRGLPGDEHKLNYKVEV